MRSGRFLCLENFARKDLCELELKIEELNKLRLAIEDFYYFEFVIDDIPIRSFLGHVEETNIFPHQHHIYLYTHHHFDFHINQNQVRHGHFLSQIEILNESFS